MRLLLVALLLWPLALSAVDRDLDDCTIGGTPTAIAPLDLDDCTINDGDDITGILTGLAGTYGDVYVKAPSQSIGVTFTDTVEFGPSGEGADEFKFFEDESAANRLTITHVPVTQDAQMWLMTNLKAITIGGSNLSMTFIGTHPGLGTGKSCTGARETCDINSQFGLIKVHLSDGSNPALADFRANFKYTWSAGVSITGGQAVGGTANRWQQVNIAGLFLASGALFNSGVQNLWFDPDRTVFMDPYNRAQGWDGGIATTSSGRNIGCSDTARQMYRNPAGASGQYIDRVAGGLTLEYGTPNVNFFVIKYFGTGADDRFLVRIKDMGSSGPTSITGLPAGVASKQGVTHGIMKNDPLPDYGFTAADQRWIAFQQLPDDYGSGMYSSSITDGLCEAGTSSNAFISGAPFIWLAEASSDGLASQYVNAYQNVKFIGAFDWDFASSTKMHIGAAGSGADKDACCDADRTFGHVLTIASESSVIGYTTMLDTITLTGPGIWGPINIDRVQIQTGSDDYINPNDNTITDTRVGGAVAVGQDATGTVIDNVEFTGAARAIITIGANSAVTLTDLCVPSGSTMTRADNTATATLDGGAVTFTANSYTFGALTDCSITADPRPGPVTGGGVQ